MGLRYKVSNVRFFEREGPSMSYKRVAMLEPDVSLDTCATHFDCSVPRSDSPAVVVRMAEYRLSGAGDTQGVIVEVAVNTKRNRHRYCTIGRQSIQE